MPRKRKTEPKSFYKAFPTAMRTLMGIHGTTQNELADYLQRTRQSISYYCDGSSSPDWETLVKIADYFDVSTDYLLGRTDTKKPDINIQAITALTGLTEDNVLTLCQEQETVAGNADDSSDCTQIITYLDCINDILDALRCDSINYAYTSYAYFREAANVSVFHDKDFHSKNEERIEEMTRFCHVHGYQVLPALFATQFFATQIVETIERYLIDKYAPKEGD